jgi:hypothetical protein
MNRNYKIKDGIYLVQNPYELDLHNNFDFTGLDYSVEDRSLILNWKRSSGDWVNPDAPELLIIEFSGVNEFRFLPRDSEMPFTEDDCLSNFGYWTDEDWADGMIIADENQNPEQNWLTALDFQSGATILVKAESAHAKIKA